MTRAAIASTIGAAWAAAHFDDIAIMPLGGERELLAPLPLAALRLPQETVARWHGRIETHWRHYRFAATAPLPPRGSA